MSRRWAISLVLLPWVPIVALLLFVMAPELDAQGASVKNIRDVRTYSATLSPVFVAANTSAEQTFTVAGLRTSDIVAVNKPTAQAGLAIAGVRVSATDTLAITFGNLTAASVTPTASQVYTILAVRR
jgi:hypothetical protein